MKKTAMWKRVSAGVAGGALLAGVAGAAFAEEQIGGGDVDVNVTIEDADEGVLAMSVAGADAPLAEVESGDPAVREFAGQLPTVTVTDTRTAEEIPDGAFWYVTGTASSFAGDAGQAEITSDHLGWQPSVADDGSGAVAVGGDVDTVLDEGPNNVGLVGQELLEMAMTSEEAIGSWEATAGLTLKVPAETAAGSYSSTLTLSLFE
ncbi:hypothetical protein [Microbacterium karelineae]|uniref:hypothetical protein n=1 Tax=Microbacterium karelineae TaxID=2654283 RepID=UPI001E3C9D62|nr:hypothetical protein [Microbacterium karelineae]